MQRGAIILCGGRSSRMGVDKALLPFGTESMVGRVVRIVGSVVSEANIVVVAASWQELPETKASVIRDPVENQGPLAALLRGAEVLTSRAHAVFVTGCDAPLLSPNAIELLFGRLGDFDCVVPDDEQRLHPLCAVYRRTALHDAVEPGNRSLHRFVETLHMMRIRSEELRVVDPELGSLRNINTREDYLAAVEAAGFSTA